MTAQKQSHVSHPRATWINPTTGKTLLFQSLMQEMANKSVVMLGETHDIAEVHRWQLHVGYSFPKGRKQPLHPPE